MVANLRRCLHYHINSDHISRFGYGHKMDASSTDKQIFEISSMSRNLCPVTSGHDLYSSVLPAKGHSRARRS